MSEVFKIALSLSLSGSLLIIVLILCKPLFKNRISKCWQYYIWLVVIARLLLPFSPQTSPVGALFEEVEQIMIQTQAPSPAKLEIAPAPQSGTDTALQEAAPQSGETPTSAAPGAQRIFKLLLQNLWLVWLVVALILLIRKITIYQGFVKYIKAGRAEVSDTALLDRLALIGEQAGVKTPVELYTNSLIASPLLLGFFRPCIVLPTADLPDSDFAYILLHELTHFKRRDMFYKWLVQLVVCLHWFNPLVSLMGREVSRACELACDEAVIRRLEPEKQRDYGDTLLNAFGFGGSYGAAIASVTLNEGKQLLKERLEAIMAFSKNRKTTAILAVMLVVCLCGGSFMLGAYMAQPTLEIPPMEQMVFSNEGLPVMNAHNRELYERYLKPIAVTGILYRNFSPEDISALLEDGSSGLLALVAVLESEKMRENTQNENVSAAFVDEVLTQYFPLRAVTIRDICADIYDANSDTYYYPGGLGGGPFIPIVTGITTNWRLTTLYYTAYVGDPAADTFQYIAKTNGEIVIQVTGNNFKYLSNKVISVEKNQPDQYGQYGLTVYVGE